MTAEPSPNHTQAPLAAEAAFSAATSVATGALTGAVTGAVTVRGVGIVGMSLALGLAAQGHRVVLQGRHGGHGRIGASAIGAQPDVRTYALNAESVALLQRLGVWASMPPDAVTPIHDMHVEGDAPSGLLDFSAWQQGVRELGWIVDAAALEAVLAQAIDASTVKRVDETAVIDPAHEASALLVIAEGGASATRDRLGVRFHRQPYGQVAVAARLVSNEPHRNVARQWFRAPEILALLPFDRPSAGHSHGLVWSVSAQRASALLAMDRTAFEAALNEATGAPAALGTLRLDGERMSWPLSIAHADRVSGEGWVLIGDAAHLVHPLAGQGLNLGLGDVVALLAVIAEREAWRPLRDARLLSRYGRRRSWPVNAMSLTTDALQLWFAHPSSVAKELRNHGMGLLNRVAPIKRWLGREALGR